MTNGAERRRDGRISVLWLARGLGPGGMERLLVTHARLGDADRFRYLAAYLTERPRSLRGELEAAGVGVFSLSDRPLGAARRLRSLLVKEKVDILHAHSPMPAAIGRVVARSLRPRPRLAYTEHNSWACYGAATRLANAATYPLDDVHLAVSADAASSAPNLLARPRAQVLVHGLPEPLGQEPLTRSSEGLRRELGVADDAIMVLCVAHHRAEKDYDNLIDALALLTAREQRADGGLAPVTVVAAGAGPLLDNARRRVAKLGLEKRLLLLGHRDDVGALMAAADGFVLASRFEGLPVALMEATAAGLPVVATAVGGIPEALAGGAGELLVPPQDPEALAEALARLADPDLRRRLGDASSLAATGFDASHAVDAQEAIYAGLVL
jgi:glycosyltransferase involved in cell wall biosynthesis